MLHAIKISENNWKICPDEPGINMVIFLTLSSSTESIIFMFFGVSLVVHIKTEYFNWAFICFTLLFITIYRAVGELVLILDFLVFLINSKYLRKLSFHRKICVESVFHAFLETLWIKIKKHFCLHNRCGHTNCSGK